jgi:hypothetical protein
MRPVARPFRPPKGCRRTRGPIAVVPSFSIHLPLLYRLSPASLLLWRDPTSPWASSGCRCLLPVYRSRGPAWISLSNSTECPVTPASPHRPGLDWILGFAFEDTLTRPVRLAQWFTHVRCHGSPPTSFPTRPHGAGSGVSRRHCRVRLPLARGCYQLAPRRTFTSNPVPMSGTPCLRSPHHMPSNRRTGGTSTYTNRNGVPRHRTTSGVRGRSPASCDIRATCIAARWSKSQILNAAEVLNIAGQLGAAFPARTRISAREGVGIIIFV